MALEADLEANSKAPRDAAPGDDVEAALAARLGPTPHLSYRYDPALAAVWLRLEPRPLPCFTPESIDSISRLQQSMAGLWGRTSATPSQPVKFLVVTSDAPRAFSTGGDLAHIVSRIEARDDVGLRAYGHAGTRACHALLDGCGAGLVTVALVRGLALGSGFEAARCCDYVVAEEGSQFGLPEARFRLFRGTARSAP